jgi:predicted dehydrogenase
MIEDDAFSRCVAMGRPAFPDFRTALSAHEVVDACSRGARLGREVSLGEP